MPKMILPKTVHIVIGGDVGDEYLSVNKDMKEVLRDDTEVNRVGVYKLVEVLTVSTKARITNHEPVR